MSKSIKWLLILSGSVFAFVFALTSPTVHLYFMQHVSPQVYATSGMVETGLAAVMASLMSKESIRYKMRRIFVFVLALDAAGYAVISLMGMDNATIRFLGLAVLSALTINIWMTLMMDAVNGVMSGTKLTDFQTLSRSWRLWGTVAGSALAIAVTGILSLEAAIWLQCGANALYALCDYKGFVNISREVLT
ncbi:hypothetical protein M7775_13775 [Sporomusa sphaeroides DSM 2875]|uniref:hypothetical protein n=1 Tax=Sporomusa sphaeroides TaxID=47679 RepID=UPI00202E741C|nr:hypothetical protein [Sporomusa sphaeroides]MCM0759623.1 hypothetical protein [Sporomusa sphaeroides DSM 2875]